jgi:hypothetical protein
MIPLIIPESLLLTLWNHLLFEGAYNLLGYSGKYGFLQRSKTPSDIARFLGQPRNYIYGKSIKLA